MKCWNVRSEIGMDLNTGEERGAGERKRRQGQLSQQTFSNNADLRRPTFENLPLVKEFFFLWEIQKLSSGVLGEFQLCWNIPCVCSSIVSVEKRQRKLIHRSEITDWFDSSWPARMQCLREGRWISDGMSDGMSDGISDSISAALHRPLTLSDQAAYVDSSRSAVVTAPEQRLQNHH